MQRRTWETRHENRWVTTAAAAVVVVVVVVVVANTVYVH
jgi:hypothetical protein